jgi:hypothetical protein
MSSMGLELAAAMRTHIGQPFQHHFSPENLCERGRTTVDQCMERGLGPNKWDCSGLVLASLCEVLGLSNAAIPWDLRHAVQIDEILGNDLREIAESGDIITLINPDLHANHGVHIGVMTISDFGESMVHVRGGADQAVVEGEIPETLILSAIISCDRLADRMVVGV